MAISPGLSYANCVQCPRRCAADRTQKQTGFCRESSAIRIASACLHFGEEPPVTGAGGSGTIFITGCNLRCSFCQNYQISQDGMGADVPAEDFIRICLALQEKGAENINIVTGSHAAPALAEALAAAKNTGLTIPVCWNSSAYETPETLELIKNVADIWLPDMKTLNPAVSRSCFAAEDYPEQAKNAILFMLDSAPLSFTPLSHTHSGSEGEKITGGVIIRHLFLPGRLDDTRVVLEWLKENADGRACISLMSQYTPVSFPGGDTEWRRNARLAFQNRLVNEEEFEALQKMIRGLDFEYLFYQELEQDTEWLPDFARTQPFSNALAKPVWHWKTGFISERASAKRQVASRF